MDESVLQQLKDLIEQCKSDPSILERPELSFFREYIEWDEEEIDDKEKDEEPDVVESDIELDDSSVVLDLDYDPSQKMGDISVEVSEENRDASQEAEKRAMEAISQGKLEVAIEHLTDAILLNPTSAILYGLRANVYIKLKKPNAAIRDLTRALEINPASAKEYKSRAIAKGMLGKWEEAAKDLRFASKLEYDEKSSDLLKKVVLNAHKIEEHRLKYDRLRKEREKRKNIEPQASFKKAKMNESSSNMLGTSLPRWVPGGMVSGFSGLLDSFPTKRFPGNMPAGNLLAMPEYAQEISLFNKIFNVPELAAVFQDPQTFFQVRDLILNRDNPVIRAKHESNPKIASIIAKFRIKCDIPE